MRDIFLLSTKNLTENKYNHYPLHFVDNATSPRLVYGYSLLIRQYALSDAAADYWEKIRTNNKEQGGLYESQPLSVKGNIHDATNADRDVLGYFGASTVKQKRIFIKNVLDLPLEYLFPCDIRAILDGFDGEPILWPYYLPAHTFIYEDSIVYSYDVAAIDHECVDCTSTVGGTIVKPDFWPN